MAMKKKIAIAVLLMISVGVLGLLMKTGYLGINQKAAAKPESGTQVGNLAPNFTLKRLDGTEVTLSELAGKRVFINFWASWCPPCRAEMPDLQAVYDEKDDDVVFLAINLGETESKVRAFLDDNGYTFPVLMDPDGQAASLYLIRAIPTSFVIDADGIVRSNHIGILNKATLNRLLANAKEKYSE